MLRSLLLYIFPGLASSIFSQTPELFEACKQGDLAKVCDLCTSPPGSSDAERALLLNQQDFSGATLLSLACQKGHLELGRWLLRQPGIDVNLPNHEKKTPFFFACQEGHLELTKLLAGDERVRMNQIMSSGISPFFIACQRGHFAVVSLLSQDPRVDVNQPEREGMTPLITACKKGKGETVRLLLRDQRVEVNQEDYEGATPLWVAAERNDQRTVKILLASGRQIDTQSIPNFEHLTASEISRERGFGEIADLIEDYERNPRKTAALLKKNLIDEFAADVFALVIFHCDDFFELVKSSS